MNTKRISAYLLFALIVLAPLGTRFIWRVGSIAGVSVEPGTLSLFGTQILAILYVLAVLVGAGGAAFGRVLRRPPALAAAGLAAVAVISVSQSGDKAFSLLAASWVVLGAALFVALRVDRPSPALCFSAIASSAAFQAGLGAWQFFSQSSPAAKWLGMAAHQPGLPGVFVIETVSGRWLRAYGTFGHPNILGFFMVLGLLACLGLIAVRSTRSREPLLALLPVLAAGLFFSFSKSAFIALAAGLMVQLLSVARERRVRIEPVVWLAALALVGAFISLGVIYREPALTRVTGASRLELRSWDERRTLAVDAFRLVSRHAALGVGAGEMPAAVWRELSDGRAGWQYQEAHNLPLLVLVDTGFAGLAFWLLLIGWFAVSIIRSARVGRPAAAMLAAVVVVGLFDHFLWSSWPGQLLFWLICGLTLIELDKDRVGTLQ